MAQVDDIWTVFLSEGAIHWINIIYILIVILVSILLFILINKFYDKLKKKFLGDIFPVRKIWVNLAVAMAAMILILTGLPGISNNVIQLVGLVLGAIVAFSSSTLIANFMSGILIKIIQPYKVGHMIKVKEHLGMVYHIGILHTEIQTPHREIVHIPNLVAISDNITNYTEGDYIVNANVSLGYDISRRKAEQLLIKAIRKTGLKDAFVLVEQLGNSSITYQANGLLEDVTEMITAKSRLMMNILDEFSKNNIEVLSPMYISKRDVLQNKKIIADRDGSLSKFFHDPNAAKKPEKVMYARADEIVKKKEKQLAEKKISAGIKNITSDK